MQSIVITGNVGRDPEKRSTQGGDEVCSFSVGVKQGWGDKASTNWFRCNVWGKRASTVHQHLRKGSKVTVNGELSIGQYDGKPQYDIRVNDVDWSPAGERHGGEEDYRGNQGAGKSQNESYGGGGGGFPDDLDDSVPFITSSPAFEGRAR